MNFIKKDEELTEWLINYITDFIHHCEADDLPAFDLWTKNFKREEAEFVVNMEFINDWGYDERKNIPQNEAEEYAQALIRIILDKWYL